MHCVLIGSSLMLNKNRARRHTLYTPAESIDWMMAMAWLRLQPSTELRKPRVDSRVEGLELSI